MATYFSIEKCLPAVLYPLAGPEALLSLVLYPAWRSRRPEQLDQRDQ